MKKIILLSMFIFFLLAPIQASACMGPRDGCDYDYDYDYFDERDKEKDPTSLYKLIGIGGLFLIYLAFKAD